MQVAVGGWRWDGCLRSGAEVHTYRACDLREIRHAIRLVVLLLLVGVISRGDQNRNSLSNFVAVPGINAELIFTPNAGFIRSIYIVHYKATEKNSTPKLSVCGRLSLTCVVLSITM